MSGAAEKKWSFFHCASNFVIFFLRVAASVRDSRRHRFAVISVAEIVRDSVQNSATGQETVDFGFDWECFPGSVEGAVSSSVRVFVLRRSATGKIVGKKNCVDIEVSSPPL